MTNRDLVAFAQSGVDKAQRKFDDLTKAGADSARIKDAQTELSAALQALDMARNPGQK